MKVKNVSIISGKETVMELDITPEQAKEWLLGGRLVQDIFPNLNSEEREFLITGITPEEWNSVMGEFEEE